MGLQGPRWYIGVCTVGEANPLPQGTQERGRGNPLAGAGVSLPTLILDLGP